jgi:uncharacterized secreted protein with C-terminal beta-propeller domain
MYKILLSAYEDILIYLNGDYDDEYILYCDSIREKIEALLQDYAITTKMSGEEILHVLEELQANSPMSILYDMYEAVKDDSDDYDDNNDDEQFDMFKDLL